MTVTPPLLRSAETPPGPWKAIIALPLVVMFFPAAVIFPGPLQSNGWPGRLLVFWVAAAVLLGWIRRPGAVRRPSPAEVGCWLLALGAFTAFAAVYLRVTSPVEEAGAVRVALVLFPLVIVAIGIASLADSRRSELLLACIVAGATFSAAVALAQFVSPFDLAELVRPPGMVSRDVGGMGDRGGFIRVKGSATHPIELGVISGAILPLAVHFARFAGTPGGRQSAWAATGIIALSIPFSVTRSGMLTAVISMTAYAVVLNLRQRLNLVVVGIAGLILMRATVPGLLGTVVGFLLGGAQDDSVQARLDDYPLVDELVSEAPLFGRGLGTFLPDEYFLLDNQYLMSLVEGGLVLAGALVVFFVLTLSAARGAKHRAHDAAGESRAQAVVAAVVGIALSAAFFDLFSFAQVTIVLFLLVGVAGALWHHTREHGYGIPAPRERLRRGIRAAPALHTPPVDHRTPSGGRLSF